MRVINATLEEMPPLNKRRTSVLNAMKSTKVLNPRTSVLNEMKSTKVLNPRRYLILKPGLEIESLSRHAS